MDNLSEKHRILMYSHDTFGLGHLRRCRAIANALVEDHHGLSVLILSGASIAGAFEYRSRVDYVKIPSVVKLRNSEYTSLSQHLDIHDTLAMRRTIIKHTAETFCPDIFIVDKAPLGLRGEIEETLSYLKRGGTRLVLGLRDVMDSPVLLRREWDKVGMMQKIDAFYDAIWVYGPKEFHDPLSGLDVPSAVRSKMEFTGFLQRHLPRQTSRLGRAEDQGYILVTPGGGGDGAFLVQSVIRAYEENPDLTQQALIVLGPYMPARERRRLMRSSASMPKIGIIEFDNRMEELIANSSAVVAMGGYNTYCEILSFDKPAVIVPRLRPREEQLVRARRAAELGLAQMVLPEEAQNPRSFAEVLRGLPSRPFPSQVRSNLELDGLNHISRIVGGWLSPATNVATFQYAEGISATQDDLPAIRQ